MVRAISTAGGAGARPEAKPESRPKVVDPVPGWQGKITSRPGQRSSPGGIGSTNHEGLDIAVPTGTPVQAAKDGKVVFADNGGGYGNLVVIQHGDGTFTKYAHQSQLNVQVGQEVKAGEVIGKSGSTGNSTGPHLHFEVRKGDWNNGAVLDPVAYLGGAESVAAADPGAGKSFAGDSSAVGGGGSPSGMSLGGGGSAGGASSSGGASYGVGGAAPSGGAGGASASGGASSSGPVGPMPEGELKDWIEEAIKILEKMGIPRDKIDPAAIAAIIKKESGGDPRAVNNWDSNAAAGHPSKGLMQTIDSTFNQYKAPGRDDIFNPVDNIVAGVRYAISRYGSLSNVPGIKAMANGGSYVGY